MKKEIISERTVEIARSFAYKYNAGNYQSQDFFCSQKAECLESQSQETSEKLYRFCKEQVIKDLNSWTKEQEDIRNFNDPNYYQKARKEAKVYEAKATDSWRGDNSPKYRATDKVGGKEIINQEAGTLEPQ